MASRGLELGLYTDSVKELSFEAALDLAARVRCDGHRDRHRRAVVSTPPRDPGPARDPSRREAFAEAFASRGLRIAALNCSAWPLHPVHGERHVELIRSTIRLAGELGIRKLVTMSGNPGDGPASTAVNFTWYPWPAESTALLERQWAATIELWQDLAAFARSHGVDRLAFELHPLHLVYNVPTLRRLREAVGPEIGANVDPSHLFWQQMDPIAVIDALGSAVYHVHLKDTQIVSDEVALAGVLDQRPFEIRLVGRGSFGRWAASMAPSTGRGSSTHSSASAMTTSSRSRTKMPA